MAAVTALAVASADAAATTIPFSGETALIRIDKQHVGYRSVPRGDTRMSEEVDADVVAATGKVIDAPHDSVRAQRIAADSRANSVDAGGTDSNSVVLPHQTYALMSAGLLSMALVMVRRRRL